MSGLPPEALEQVRRVFVEDSPARLERLAAGLGRLAEGGETDQDALRVEAHSLRGAAATLGIKQLASLCGSIEDLLAETAPDAEELRAAARLVETARRRIAPGSVAPRRLRDRFLRHRFVRRFAAILLLAAEALERRTEEREPGLADLASLAGEPAQPLPERSLGLEEAREIAERGAEASTAFLGRLSHELRTPLNALQGFSQLLAAESLEPLDRLEAAKQISASAEHMTRLVDELLDTARVESGQLRVELTPVSAAGVVEDVLNLAGALAADHEVALLAAEVPPGLTVNADRARLRQAFLNLVTNAVVYNRRGGAVTVRVEHRDGRVLFDVLDTGAGIAAADLERLFIPYDRLGRGSESGRLGLGLALSKRIVEAMGGSIAVESDEGVGSRFTIELAEAPAGRTGGDSVRIAASGPAGERRVLYIEDNPTSLKLVELMLRGRGIELISASSAADGLKAARSSHVDLILLDRQLPDGSGEEVLAELRRDRALRAVPIVMLSGDASRETVRRVLEAGADDYLTKPLELDRAAEVIERFLNRSHE